MGMDVGNKRVESKSQITINKLACLVGFEMLQGLYKLVRITNRIKMRIVGKLAEDLASFAVETSKCVSA